MTLEELYKLVQNHMDWNDNKTNLWFNTPNPLLGQITPKVFFEMKPEKCSRFILALIEENSAPV
jgi:hypothetical protein